MGSRTFDIAALILNLLHYACSNDILSCNVTFLEPCPGANQVCNATTSHCDCERGFTMIGEECHENNSTPASHAMTAVLVTIFATALIVCGLVLLIRKYKLIDYARQKFNLRRNNDVMYEDVMIGQDDPPLSP